MDLPKSRQQRECFPSCSAYSGAVVHNESGLPLLEQEDVTSTAETHEVVKMIKLYRPHSPLWSRIVAVITAV